LEKDIYRPIAPPSELSQYVRRFMVADCDDPLDVSVPVRPTGYLFLGWILRGEARALVDGAVVIDTDDSRFHISGQVRSAEISLELKGRFQHALVEFTALGAYQLLGVEGQDVFEKAVKADDYCPDLVQSLRGKTTPSSPDGDTGGLAILTDYLKVQDPRDVADYLPKGVEQIEAVHGNLRIADLCDDLGISERQFSREFTRIVGLNPKTFAKTLQVNHAIGLVMMDDQTSLAEIAVQAGFADQQHFSKVFRDVVLMSPLAFLKSDEDMLFTFLARSSKEGTYL